MAQFSEETNAQLLNRLKSSNLCGNSSVVTKCKLYLFTCDVVAVLTARYAFLGSMLFHRFPQTVEEFLGRLEAFMINQNLHKIDIDSMGKLEQVLFSDFRKVCCTISPCIFCILLYFFVIYRICSHPR